MRGAVGAVVGGVVVVVAPLVALLVGIRAVATRSGRPWRSRLLATRGRLPTAELLEEIVEQVAHLQWSLPVRPRYGRWRPSTARENAASTVSASSFGRIAAARAGSN